VYLAGTDKFMSKQVAGVQKPLVVNTTHSMQIQILCNMGMKSEKIEKQSPSHTKITST
jgi:hypothetical protein